MTYSSQMKKPPTEPKHGKVDASGSPHVGGDTWAGGTGNQICSHDKYTFTL